MCAMFFALNKNMMLRGGGGELLKLSNCTVSSFYINNFIFTPEILSFFYRCAINLVSALNANVRARSYVRMYSFFFTFVVNSLCAAERIFARDVRISGVIELCELAEQYT